jgi:bacillithiol system protein YtxJ
MSFFESIMGVFSGGSEPDRSQWGEISASSELKDIDEVSYEKIQIIYKHSSRCATSYFALRNLQDLSEEIRKVADLYMVDVIGQRSLSNEISSHYDVRHESPQVILIREGQVRWNGSHGEVRSDVIKEVIEKI